MTRARNRAAQDLTLINLRALKKRVAVLERTVRRIDVLDRMVRGALAACLERRLDRPARKRASSR